MGEFIDFPPIPIRPVTEVTPFTYRDGFTYMSILNQLVEWIRDKIVPKLGEIDAELAAYINDVNTRIQAIIDELNNALATLDPEHVSELVASLEPRIVAIQSDLSTFKSQYIQFVNDYNDRFIDLGDNRIAVATPNNVVGETTRVRVRNVSGSSIPVLSAVSLSSSNSSEYPGVALYDGTRPILGVSSEIIPNGSNGWVMRSGRINADTTSYPDGGILYAQLSGVVNATPSAYQVGSVVDVGSQGAIYVTLEAKFDETIAAINAALQQVTVLVGQASTYATTAHDSSVTAKAFKDSAENARDAAIEAVNRIDYSDSGWKPIVSGGGGISIRPESGYRILNGVLYLNLVGDGPLVNDWQTLARLPKSVAPVNVTPLSYLISGSNNGPTVRTALYPNTTDCSIDLFSNSTMPALTHYVSGSWVVPPK